MAGNKRPSYLKRLKEQQRKDRAEAKRVARRTRKQEQGVEPEDSALDAELGEPQEVEPEQEV